MRSKSTTCRGQRPSAGRRFPAHGPGFTLLEMLIAIGILLFLTGLTIAVVNATLDGDRMRGASRQVQSYLEGARDRAIYAGEPRGIRFQLDPDDPSAVNSMVFIGPPEDFTEAKIVISSTDSRTITTPTAVPPDPPEAPPTWAQLRNRRLLVDGARITIEDNTYTIAFDTAAVPPVWKLTKDFTGIPNTERDYELELAPAVLPNQEPRILPQGVVIDLDQSRLPAGWGSGVPYTPRLDVLFSPRGTVTGDVASAGRVHFVLANLADATRNVPVAAAWQPSTTYSAGDTSTPPDPDWIVPDPLSFLAFQCTTLDPGLPSGAGPSIPPEFLLPANQQPGATFTDSDGLTWQTFEKSQNLIVSLATQTGKVSTHPVWDNRPAGSAVPLDPFRYAETGEVAK